MPQIITRVLGDAGIRTYAYHFQLGPYCYSERDYCIQHYDETDLHLIQRLCDEEGLHHHFEHSQDPACYTPLEDHQPLPFVLPGVRLLSTRFDPDGS